jgi:hypothetical protein
MTVTGLAAGTRFFAAALAVAGAAVFGLFAIGQPLGFLTSGAPVTPAMALHAWAGPLAGLPMAALLYFAAAVALRMPSGQAEWEAFAARCLHAGIWGLGLGAFWAAIALGGALFLYGQSTIYLMGAWILEPMTGVFAGLALVVSVNLARMKAAGVWAGLGHVLWGFSGVLALAVGLPMLGDAVAIQDSRTLMQRYNLLIVFYPLLWLGFAGLSAAIVICGIRWVRFGLSAPQRNEVSPPSTGSTWPVTYEDSPEIRNKAA